MDLIDNNENNMIAAQSNIPRMTVTIEFPRELTQEQRDLKNDLLTIFASANDLQRKISDATDKMLMNTEVWKELITMNFSEEARKRKVAHFLATNWIKEQNDDLIHIVGMLKSKNCQLNNIKMEDKSKEERLDLFLKEVGRTIAHWIKIEFAIDLIVDRDYKDAQTKGNSLRMTTQERNYTKALHQAYRMIINESNMIKDKNSNMHHYMKSVVEKYYHRICNVIRLDEKDIKVQPVDKIFMHNPDAVNIEDILRSIESKFAMEMEKAQHNTRALVIALISDLKTILQNWDDIVKAEETVRKLFYSEKLENLVYNLNGRDENTLKEFNKKLDKYISQHIKRKEADVLKAHAKIHGIQSKTEYLLKIYHNLINLIKNNGDIIKKAKQIEFSTNIIQCLGGGELYKIYSYQAESRVQPFSREQKSIVNNYGIGSKRKIFSSLGRLISLFWSRRMHHVVYESTILQENTQQFGNGSVLSKTMNVLKDTANGICSAFDDIEEVCVKAATETMSAVGLSRMENSYEYIENKPMQEPIVEENSQPLRHTHVDASNGAPAWIRTEPSTKPLIIAHTVPFLIVTAILLRLSIYSTTMGFGLVIKYLKNTAAFNLFKVNAGLIGLIGIFLVKNTTNILLTTAKDIWNRKAKGSAICAAVIVLYTTVVVGSGLLGPLTLNVQELEVSLYWIVIFALTTWAFVKYDRDLREEIEEEEYSSENFKKVDRSTFIVCFCCFSTTLITLLFYVMHETIKYVAPVKVNTL
ncbi:uncharacterized protein NESG_01954 [Nematocida ausubeli]|uniref:Uncharacterized protein n=1 Tax=Nematocida ausubeli (strain ATCC PRA-371 / ERTm2) TaxID=1913371 RepID=A0A086J1E6_NEMA1|nr:uncharacterized protein NESG_01954 [Nematocida ausubeli]KAI5132744.1 hypothetical protein NEAUS06_0340 [Nematocida ausubeli]KFG25964.1 hypothetical protein NESG_01954 [Nematocida ausubeli]